MIKLNRTCKQCGGIKPLNNSNYRQYYGGRRGYYRLCLLCEKINTRYKYLKGKTNRSDTDSTEFLQIEEYYKSLIERGLTPPQTKHITPSGVGDLLVQQLGDTGILKGDDTGGLGDDDACMPKDNDNDTGTSQFSATGMLQFSDTGMPQFSDAATQEELQYWLTVDLSKFDIEELQDSIIENLQTKYRPSLGLDENYTPIYDNKYRKELNLIITRFDDYEDSL